MAVSITVTRGTSTVVRFTFTVPSWSGSTPNPTYTLTDPVTVQLIWRVGGGTDTTWTYTSSGGHITKLSTGVYTATIPSKTVTATTISGKVVGTGNCTAVGQFSIVVDPTAV